MKIPLNDYFDNYACLLFLKNADIEKEYFDTVGQIIVTLANTLSIKVENIDANMSPDKLKKLIPFWHDCSEIDFLVPLSILMEFNIDDISFKKFPRLFHTKIFGKTIFRGTETVGEWVRLLICWLETNGVNCRCNNMIDCPEVPPFNKYPQNENEEPNRKTGTKTTDDFEDA
jgi:hypothetical protein